MHFRDASDDRGLGGIRPAHAHLTDYCARMLCIRQRVTDGVYDSPALIAHVARRLIASGDVSEPARS